MIRDILASRFEFRFEGTGQYARKQKRLSVSIMDIICGIVASAVFLIIASWIGNHLSPSVVYYGWPRLVSGTILETVILVVVITMIGALINGSVAD